MTPLNAQRFAHTAVATFQMSLRSMGIHRAAMLGFLVFAACLVVLFPFALGTDLILTVEVRFGAFWMVQEFLVALVMGRIFENEREAGMLNFWLASRSPRQAIVVGKIAATFMQLVVLQIPLGLLWFIFFKVPMQNAIPTFQKIVPTALLFDAGTASLGVLLNCIVARTRAREIVFPVLFFPLQVTPLLAAVNLCLRGESNMVVESVSAATWWMLLAFFPVVFTAIGFLFGNDLFRE